MFGFIFGLILGFILTLALELFFAWLLLFKRDEKANKTLENNYQIK